ncbi:MAG: GrpB family protein [Phenylobacterium sp.]|uniref:GrpB family protein n=1 Tax=Phenylobacterium sp. TaxID=1871053 RepID=UPI003BB80F3E
MARPFEPIEIAEPSPAWAAAFALKGAELRLAMGPMASRIDHIGSTAIPGLAAKPILDIQISVVGFEPMETLEAALGRAGYVWRADNPERTKRYFREAPGAARTHVHVRIAGSWHEQWALLFRDYLRDTAAELKPYATLKRDLAARHGADRAAYVDGKADHFWAVIRRADDWAKATGWQPSPSDA